MSAEPAVAVVIPAYRAEPWLAETIESALTQEHRPAEVVVVDDGSPDGTAAVAARYDGRVTLLRQQNRGVAAARNAGIAATTAPLVAFLDADDVWLPAKLARQVARFVDDPSLGLVHVGVEEVDGAGHHLGYRDDGREGAVADDILLGRPTILGGGSGSMVRRDLLDAVGGFDERLSTSADWDLYRRVARLAPVAFVPEPLVRYRLHDSNMHRNVDALVHDKLIALATAFGPDATPGELALRSETYGRTHLVLAGSYLEARRFGPALAHVARGLRADPSQLGALLAAAGRRLPGRH